MVDLAAIAAIEVTANELGYFREAGASEVLLPIRMGGVSVLDLGHRHL
jgi:hypothetical protein